MLDFYVGSGWRLSLLGLFPSFAHTGATMDPGSSVPVATDDDIQVIQHVLISRYFTAAAAVVLLYDALLTLNEEVSSCK